jgi:recombination protein RecA
MDDKKNIDKNNNIDTRSTSVQIEEKKTQDEALKNIDRTTSSVQTAEKRRPTDESTRKAEPRTVSAAQLAETAESTRKSESRTVSAAQVAEKRKAVEESLKSIKKKFGEGTRFLESNEDISEIEYISTGSVQLDFKIGIGGIPKGRITEIYGPEGCGKTTLALSIIAQAQKRGGIAAFIDAEHALNKKYAEQIGVDMRSIVISQPDYGEQGFQIADQLISSGGIDVVVIDSVAALIPQTELQGEMGDTTVAGHARLMSHGLRKLIPAIDTNKTAVIFINQIRHKIGVMYGSPETTTGGNSLKFYASLRLDIRKRALLKDSSGRPLGQEVEVKILKNKFAAPFEEVKFDLIYGRGIDREGEIFNLGVETGVIEKSGSWFSYDKKNIGQGKEAASNHLRENSLTERVFQEAIKILKERSK